MTTTTTTLTTLTGPLTQTEEITPESTSASVPLIAYPFHSISEVNEFCGAVRRLPGVRNVRYMSAAGGVLRLEVTSEHVVPLCVMVRGLRDVDWSPVHLGADMVEISLN